VCNVRSFSAVVTSLSALCLDLWTSVCLCLFALLKRASIHILRAVHSADIGIITDTTSNHSTMHTLCLRSWPAVRTVSLVLSVSNRRYKYCSAAFKSAVLLTIIVNIASEMHFNASRSLTQTCMTACHSISMSQPCYQALQISAFLGTGV